MNVMPQQKSREQQAWAEVGHTGVRPAGAWALVGFFLLLCTTVPLWQIAADWHEARLRGEPYQPQAIASIRQWPESLSSSIEQGGALSGIVAVNRHLLERIKEYEDRLDDESRLGRWIRPPLQAAFSRWLGVGNEKVYVGKDGWLFYRPDLDSLTDRGFLDPRQLAHRATAGAEWQALLQPDPRPAILDFKRQLDERGIELILMPTPVKPSIHPEHFSGRLAGRDHALHNSSYGAFLQEMEQAGVRVFDPANLLVQRSRRTGEPQYLASDTHWRPEAMEAVAEALARMVSEMGVRRGGATTSSPLLRQTLDWRADGDVARMLDLPKDHIIFPPESVVLHQVLGGDGQFWRASEEAEVLMLGDSFSNIYSLEALGWGESAGLVEQLASHLGVPVDRLVRNDAGAFATRDMLRREMAQGRDRLAGKRVVVWQFAARELAAGDWRLIPLDLGEPPPTRFVVPASGESRVVTGTVRSVSSVPRPGTVPYRDHILSIHLVDLPDNGEAVVYLSSMVNNEWTHAARLRNGMGVTLRLRPWAEVAGQLDSINRSELDNWELQLQEPCWGDWIE